MINKVIFNVDDPLTQDLLWAYSLRSDDKAFSDDIQASLKAAGYKTPECQLCAIFKISQISEFCDEHLAEQTLEVQARSFATMAHKDQKRKYTGEPYITHPLAVAEIVRSVPHTEEMIAAAILHDTVEDTDVTIDDIEWTFGDDVADLVAWLTDVSKPSDGNRAKRKAIDREHLAQAPPQAKTIKLADLIHNSDSILAHDAKFAATYLEEKMLLLPFLKSGDPTLWQRANEIVNQAKP